MNSKYLALSLWLLAATMLPLLTESSLAFNAERFIKLAGDMREVLGNVTSIPADCRQHLLQLCDAIENEDNWAWQMADAWGWPQSGYMRGDGVWEGSYEGCNKVSNTGSQLAPHFCMITWSGQVESDGIGLCVPKTCSGADMKDVLIAGAFADKMSLPHKFPTNFGSSQTFCTHPVSQKPLDGSAVAAIVILSIFGIFILIGTCADGIVAYCKPAKCCARAIINDGEATQTLGSIEMTQASEGSIEPLPTANSNASEEHGASHKHETASAADAPVDNNVHATPSGKGATIMDILVAFSVIRHLPRLVSFEHSKRDIKCLHGVRALAFAWIVLGHSWQLGISLTSTHTIVNKYQLEEIGRTLPHHVVNRMALAVEGFFVLSGMLTAISFLTKLDKMKKPNCKMMTIYYFHRWWRLTPAYMLIVMFYGCLFGYLGSGPLFTPWMAYENCKTGWWRNLLYINNLHFLGGPDCLGWSWYLANDFQFYVISPLYLFGLFYKPVVGYVAIGLSILGCLIARIVLYIQVYENYTFWNFYSSVYVTPWGRCATYFLGLLLGYILWKRKLRPIKMHKALLIFLWVMMLIVSQLIVFPLAGVPATYISSMVFDILKRPVFGVVICWVIFACVTGNGGFINIFLSWNGWLPISKLSYIGYLVHPIVIYATYYSSPVQIYVSTWSMTYYFLGHLVMTCMISLIVSVCLEAPFAALEQILMMSVNRKREA